jgi:ubiquinone/menaquinone biosynthesis C-methylase UbiE
MFRTDYTTHDGEYRRRRAGGRPGWNTPDVLAEQLALLEEVFAADHFPQSGRLLELGCGAGDRTLWAARRGYEVYGLDISPFAIGWAREKLESAGLSAHLEIGDVCDLSRFARAEFDIVLDGHCLHCIVGEDRPVVLREVRRVLNCEGVLHVASMCGDPSDPELIHRFDPVSRCLISNDVAVRYLGTPDSIERELIATGFSVINQRVLPRRHAEELDLLLIDARRAR